MNNEYLPEFEWIDFWESDSFEVLQVKRGNRSIYTLSESISGDAINVEGKELIAFAKKLLESEDE